MDPNSHLVGLALDPEDQEPAVRSSMDSEDCSQLEVLDLEVDLVAVEGHYNRLLAEMETRHENHHVLLGCLLDLHHEGHHHVADPDAGEAVRSRIEGSAEDNSKEVDLEAAVVEENCR